MKIRLLPLGVALLVAGCTGRVVENPPLQGTPEGGSSGATGAHVTGPVAASSTTGGAQAGTTGSTSTSASSGSTSSTSSGGSGSSSGSGTSGGTTGSATVAPGATEPVGTVMTAVNNVNLRQNPSTGSPVLVVVAAGSTVTVFEDTPRGGFFDVSYGGIHGWSYGSYYTVTSVPSSSPAPTLREQAIQRGETAMGFSYWWGHGRFDPNGVDPSNVGTCSGSCPSCSHGGSYGGDCSGMVGKAWFLGTTDLGVDSHPYSTANFVTANSNWHDVDRGSLQMGDALVYNTSGAGHIFLYERGDGWGSMWTYECKGCSYGCVHDLRTAGTAYKGIGRTGW